MAAIISLLRAVNVGGHNKISMERLRAVYVSLGFDDPQSYVQSGNIVFRTSERSLPKLATRIEDAIEQNFGLRTPVILRTVSQMREVIVRNPFAGRSDVEPNKLLVTFLAKEIGSGIDEKIRAFRAHPEELKVAGSELYVYFPNGAGRSKLNAAALEKVVGCAGTARNWNTVCKLLEMAESG